ncbi:hypothetical protein [uncultured Gimesia sp.]|uniref:ORC-CDC6 family AAA ATPase n=1 Tax=uncultured Gimesia sp. TaxID=1678688 RepID=UPI0030DA3043|tara:strand:+ start:65689 stop:67554 length:1866 start_codon:yes stop_codon:yes gene_type:complete
MTEVEEIRNDLSKLFAYKAEWLKGRLFDLFTAPQYLSKLAVDVPCVLMGGRGTGKTTVLRGLSYQGQYALSDKEPETIRNWPHFGFYLRINTNRVTAFDGPEVADAKWQKLFAHYVNLVFCDLVLEFLKWYEVHTKQSIEITSNSLDQFANSLSLENAKTLQDVHHNISNALVTFESYINNIEDEPPVKLSLQGVPIDLLIKWLRTTPYFCDKQFSFLIDEYENLNIPQQQVVNTLIKHASDAYTFKIGVRELGWRCKTTLNVDEQLISPADYNLFNISDELKSDFAEFGEKVCNARLKALQQVHPNVPDSIVDLFPGLSISEEALKLGVGVIAKKIEASLKNLSVKASDFFASLSPLEVFFLQFKAEADSIPIEDVIEQAATDKEWKTKFDNNSYALLFTIKKGKRGIRKFYCGWRVFALLANGNLRYLIELVDASISSHLSDGRNFSQPVSPETQTKAAQQVGKKNLAELEGLSIHGAKLTKLLLGLGRVFGIMAGDAAGHAPEVNQFEISDNTKLEEVDDLLNYGVMHLALVRFTGTKAAGLDTKDYDYSVHPIFAPFFVFSHRKKRKMKIRGEDFLSLVNNTSVAIDRILSKSQRSQSESLPDQLTLFENYFDEHSK